MYNRVRTLLPGPIKAAMKTMTRGAITSEPLHRAARDLWAEIKIAQATWSAHKAFQSLKGKRDLKIHLGCGRDIRPGWVNIDMAANPPAGSNPAAHPETLLINYDLRLGLPLEEHSCANIYSSHFFEHLEYKHGLRLMHDCYRALKAGGVFRLCMPSYRACFEAYLRNDRDFFGLLDYGLAEPETRLISDYVTYAIYQYGEHKCVYDEERFRTILPRIGFSSVVSAEFQEDLDIGTELRRKYSYYLEAVK